MLLKGCVTRLGGKAYLSQWLCGFLPEHERYIETFAGGAKLFFYKESSPIEILNDRDDTLINLYKVIQDDEKRQELIRILNKTPYSRSIFNHFRKSEPQDEIERAVRFFYLSKSSFCGDSEKGGFACPSRSTTRNPAQTYQNTIDVLELIAKRLKGVTIECLDYKNCISRYDSETSLFFVDAPYLLGNSNKARRYYGLNFGYEDHVELSSLLHSVKGKVMFCHYEHPEVNKLYAGWRRYEYSSFKGSHKSEGESKPKTVEILYCNFEALRQRRLFNGYV